ncbi:MAG: rhodanese-like domain-containing protein [Cytophagales bacterium]|nr:rhodanese-like domain-containing protein [Cytophagales bacterium]
MKIRFVLSIVLVCLGLVAAILPQRQNSSMELDAKQLLNEIQLENYMISVDEMANALINNDPEYQLIDVRSEEAFKAYSLPGALNIPFEKLFDEAWAPYIDQVARKNVFYSNGTTLASEVWMLTRQKGFKNNYILRGGLNNWYATVLDPKEPVATDGEEAFFDYRARLGMKQFFTGEGTPASTSNVKAKKPVPRRKKKMVAGGCS